MFKNLTAIVSTITKKIGESEVTKTGTLHVDGDTSFEMVYEMLIDLCAIVKNTEGQIKAQQAAVQVTETPAEAIVPAVAAPNIENVEIVQPEVQRDYA